MKNSELKTYIDFSKLYLILSDLEEIQRVINNIDHNDFSDNKIIPKNNKNKYKVLLGNVLEKQYIKKINIIKDKLNNNIYKLEYLDNISIDNIFLENFYRKEYSLYTLSDIGYKYINFNILKDIKNYKTKFNLNELESLILYNFINNGYEAVFELGKDKSLELPRDIRVSLLISIEFWDYFENKLHGTCFDDKEALFVLEGLISNNYYEKDSKGKWINLEYTDKEKDNERLHSNIMSIGIELNDKYENFSKEEKILYNKIENILNK